MGGHFLSRIGRSRGVKYLKKFAKHYFGGLYNRTDRHHIFLLAGGLAFSLFVCIIPLILIIFSVVGVLLEKPAVSNEINNFIDRVIPYEDYASFVKEKVFARMDEFRLYKSLAGIIGMVGLFIASSGLFSSMRTILNLVYRVRSREHILVSKLRDFGMIMLVLVYFLLSTAVLPAIGIIEEFARGVDFFEKIGLGFLEEIAFGGFTFLVIFFAFIVMYWTVPHIKLPNRVILVSALWAAVLWEVAKELFGFYLTNVFTLKRVYGAYVLIIAVAFWVYYTSIVFIIGAEIGQLYRERLKKRSSPVVNPK